MLSSLREFHRHALPGSLQQAPLPELRCAHHRRVPGPWRGAMSASDLVGCAGEKNARTGAREP